MKKNWKSQVFKVYREVKKLTLHRLNDQEEKAWVKYDRALMYRSLIS